MSKPTEMFRIELRAMSDGQLLVSYPPDQYEGQGLAQKLLDAAKAVVEERAKLGQRIVQPIAGSSFDVRPHLAEGS